MRGRASRDFSNWDICSAQAAYERAFSASKSYKRLRWMPQLGNVNMTIELRDRTVTTDATPLQAAIIELFDKQGALTVLRTSCHALTMVRTSVADTWTSENLTQELKVTEAGTMRNALYFWSNLGVLASMPDDLWRLQEEQHAQAGSAEAAPVHGQSTSSQRDLSARTAQSCRLSDSHGGRASRSSKCRRQAGRRGEQSFPRRQRRLLTLNFRLCRCASSGSTFRAWCGTSLLSSHLTRTDLYCWM